MTIDANNSIATARNLGTLPANTTVFASDSVNFNDDRNDFFRLQLSTTSTLIFDIAATPGINSFELIRDANGNKVVDAGDTILRTDNLALTSKSVNGLTAGTYFLKATAQGAKLSSTRNYTIEARAIPGAGIERVNESPREATVVAGNLNGTRVFGGELASGGDINDFYKLQIGTPSQFTAFLDRSKDIFSFSPNVDMTLFRDVDRDGNLETNEVIARSSQLGNRNELINVALSQAGEYFLQITKPNVGVIDNSRAGYDLTLTGTPNSTFSSSSVPKTFGTSGDDDIQGRNIGGIVNAGRGNDIINAAGGNDIVLCGAGNDRANGGIGDDLIDGGSGRNRINGGQGADTFVLSKQGVQLIQDFRNGIDRLGLANKLVEEALTIVQRGSDTVVKTGDDPLAVLKNVQASSINGDDFVQIAHARSGNLLMPIVVG